MVTKIIADMLQLRDTYENWMLSTFIMLEGQIGFAIDTFDFRIGDGLHIWQDLPIPNKQDFDNIYKIIEEIKKTIEDGGISSDVLNDLNSKINKNTGDINLLKNRLNIAENNILNLKNNLSNFQIEVDNKFEDIQGDIIQYIIDNSIGGSNETATTIKTKYESNPDTNAFTDAYKNKLDNIQNNAQANQNAFSSVKVNNTTINANTTTDTLSLIAGTNITLIPNTNGKSIIISSSGNGGNSNTETGDIYYSVPLGSIIAYHGEIDDIPSGWSICDGSNGTPDLVGKFIRGSIKSGVTGGSNTVTLSVSNLPSHSHTSTVSSHSHNVTIPSHTHTLSHNHEIAYPQHSHNIGGFVPWMDITPSSSTVINVGVMSYPLTSSGWNNFIPSYSTLAGKYWGYLNRTQNWTASGYGTSGGASTATTSSGSSSSGDTGGAKSSVTISSVGSGTSFNILPTYYDLIFIMKTSEEDPVIIPPTTPSTDFWSIVPKGLPLMWNQDVSLIPEGFAICDGNNGTPNLIDKFIKGATTSGGTGGKNSLVLTLGNLPSHTHAFNGTAHTHTGTGSATTSAGSHFHKYGEDNYGTAYKIPYPYSNNISTNRFSVVSTINNNVAPVDPNGDGWSSVTQTVNAGDHVHQINNLTIGSSSTAGDISSTGNSTEFDNQPSYYEMVFIMRITDGPITQPVEPNIPVNSITLNQTNLTLIEGETYSLIPTITPSNATNKFVTWSSSNTTIATVNTSGIVTCIKKGNAIITATTQSTFKTASCNLTINELTNNSYLKPIHTSFVSEASWHLPFPVEYNETEQCYTQIAITDKFSEFMFSTFWRYKDQNNNIIATYPGENIVTVENPNSLLNLTLQGGVVENLDYNLSFSPDGIGGYSRRIALLGNFVNNYPEHTETIVKIKEGSKTLFIIYFRNYYV